MPPSHADLVARNKEFTMASWTAQNAWNPISMDHGDGVYFWDVEGNRYLDWSAQIFNVNVGHNHPHVVQALQDQVARLAYAAPGMATEVRARLGEMLRAIVPVEEGKTFFTLGGSDANENAMKIARLSTGRQKIITRYRSYHGATFAAASAGGDPRRLANEPGVPWIVRVPDPYAYRSPLYRGRTAAEGDQALVDLMEETIQMEGPNQIAAILLEGYSGSSGVIQGGAVYWRGVQALCEKYGILLIIDEVMSGFGRTGEWFGIDHYPEVKPDMVTMAKGLTSGYAPLGAVTVSKKVASYFDDHTFYGGLTYNAHALSCAAAIANIEVYRDENLIERAREMGKLLRAGMIDLAEKHPSVGDVRGTGLHFVLELVADRETRAPLSPFNQPLTEPMKAVAAALRNHGLSAFVRWNYVFSFPPLVINREQIQEGLDIIDKALEEADGFV